VGAKKGRIDFGCYVVVFGLLISALHLLEPYHTTPYPFGLDHIPLLYSLSTPPLPSFTLAHVRQPAPQAPHRPILSQFRPISYIYSSNSGDILDKFYPVDSVHLQSIHSILQAFSRYSSHLLDSATFQPIARIPTIKNSTRTNTPNT